MARPQLRSMNAELRQGGYIDGHMKQLRPDSCSNGPDAAVNYASRRSLSLPYYGIGEPRMYNVMGTNSLVPAPYFVENKFETEENRGTFGKTW